MNIRRTIATLGTALAVAAGIGAAPAIAAPSAPAVPDVNTIVKDTGIELPSPDEIEQLIEDGALDAHDAALLQAGQIPAEFRDAYAQGVRDLTDLVAPGAVQQREDDRAAKARAEAAARAEAERAAARQAELDSTRNTPCPASARVCVDIDGKRTWLQQGGDTSYGPVPMSPGKSGQDTPRGSFAVQYKVKDEVSREFNNAPMPYAVYFTLNGHAFHQGTLDSQSAGCVRLNNQDAVTYFNALQPGDQVFIY
ncbi:MAG: L,D-transpeptidase [Mycobacteriaceae bacterium]|uniref:L,D-transpeptidase n=1 Tax=Corynebacterium sp. TaxID=1720 RepID=UPI003F96D1CC